MDKRRYTLSADDVRLMKQAIRRIGAGKGSTRPLPTRRRNRGGGAGRPEITENEFNAGEALDYESSADGDVYNATGRPVWDNNRSALFGQMILASEAPESFVCQVATAPPTTMADLDLLETANYRFPCGDDVLSALFTAIPLADPFGFLPDAVVGDYLYVRIMRDGEAGEDPGWQGVVIRSQQEAENASTGGGGGGDPWTGWPGPDPSTGVAPGIVFKAFVNEGSHVTGGHSPFAFDGGSTIVGTAPAAGNCVNTFGRAFINNEEILVFGDAAGNYYGIKIRETIAYATVNEANGVGLDDPDFAVNDFSSISGVMPNSGTASNNILTLQLANNQVIPVMLKDSGGWAPLITYDKATFVTTGVISARTGSNPYTWGTGNATMLIKTATNSHTSTGGPTGTLYNSTTTTVASGRIVQGKLINGQWMVDVDDC